MIDHTSTHGMHGIAGAGIAIIVVFLFPQSATNSLSLISCFFGILLWGRKVNPVTDQFGRIATFLLSFAWIASLLSVVQASSRRAMASALIPAIALAASTLFIGRLARLYYEDRQWLIRLKKSDGQQTKKMPAFSSEDFSKMESSV